MRRIDPSKGWEKAGEYEREMKEVAKLLDELLTYCHDSFPYFPSNSAEETRVASKCDMKIIELKERGLL